ncbi:MAG: type 4a pilus biogenesis protein PilO [Acidobacteriia bacterium]|nr:type 4a pilus biogenesis protein PilO [Terriglobia bacterium]
MPDLRQTRKKMKLTLAVLAGVDLLAAVLYFSPVVGSAESRQMEKNQLQAELTAKTRQVAPLKDLPQKVNIAKGQISDFYRNRFPSQNSQIYMELGKIAAANSVKIDQVRYKPADTTSNGLLPIEMEADLSGSYASLAHFINAIERDEMFFIINSVTLGGEPQGDVKLSVKLEAYLKVGT